MKSTCATIAASMLTSKRVNVDGWGVSAEVIPGGQEYKCKLERRDKIARAWPGSGVC